MWRQNTQNLLTSSGEIHSKDPFLVMNPDEIQYINVVGEDLENQDSFEVTKYIWSDVENDSPDKMMNTSLKGVLRSSIFEDRDGFYADSAMNKRGAIANTTARGPVCSQNTKMGVIFPSSRFDTPKTPARSV